MGLLCGRAILPGVMHPNVLKVMNSLPDKSKWKITNSQGVFGAEEALDSIIQSINKSKL
jgi:hypothetical protein